VRELGSRFIPLEGELVNKVLRMWFLRISGHRQRDQKLGDQYLESATTPKMWFQNQAFLECVDIPEALFMRHVGTRIIMFVERVDWIGQAIYILHGEARGTWPRISI
jgi:hypothetical protein